MKKTQIESLSRHLHLLGAKALVLLACFVVASNALGAATVDWERAADGTFSDGSNWVGGSPPTSGDTVRFDTGAQPVYTVTFSEHAESLAAEVGDFSEVVWDLNGGVYFLTPEPDEASLVVGRDSLGTLEIRNGSIQSRSAVFLLGDGRRGSQGSLTLSGHDTFFEVLEGGERSPIVGNSVTDEGLESVLRIQDGARMKLQRLTVGNSSGTRGFVEVVGEGSLLETGHSVRTGYGYGTIRVADGGMWDQSGSGTTIGMATEHDGGGRLIIDNGRVAAQNLRVGQKAVLEFTLHTSGAEPLIVLNSPRSNLVFESGSYGSAGIEIRLAEGFQSGLGEEFTLVAHVVANPLEFNIEGKPDQMGMWLEDGATLALDGYEFRVGILAGPGGSITLTTTKTP